nr:Os01g0312600 [Ipomoea batatas]GMD70965.1 Os01g0312600 [Ipomoea batatas]
MSSNFNGGDIDFDLLAFSRVRQYFSVKYLDAANKLDYNRITDKSRGGQIDIKRNAGGRNPLLSEYEVSDGELISLTSVKDSIALPFHSCARVRTRSSVLDRNAGVLVGILPSLRGEDVLLIVHGFPGVEIAVLEDDGGVAEYEVHRAVDVAVAVELAEGVDVESVLVRNEAAVEEDRQVGAAPQRHRLVLFRSGIVLDLSGAVLSYCEIRFCLARRSLQKRPVFLLEPLGEPVFDFAVFREDFVGIRFEFFLFNLFEHGEGVAHVMGDLDEPLLDDAAHVFLAVGEAVEARGLVGHGGAEERLQVNVVLGRRGGGGEVGEHFFELVAGLGEQLEAVVERPLLQRP